MMTAVDNDNDFDGGLHWQWTKAAVVHIRGDGTDGEGQAREKGRQQWQKGKEGVLRGRAVWTDVLDEFAQCLYSQ